MFLGLALAATFAAGPAASQEQRASLYHKFEFSPSLTSVILNSHIRIDSDDGSIGTDVDAEDDLGLDAVKWEPRFAVRWRPGRHHEIEGGYQFARRGSEHELQRTITVRDTTFDAGLNIKSNMQTDLAFLNYRYAIIAKEKTQAGVGIGTGALLFKTAIDALAFAGSNDVTYSASQKLTVPVGAFGIYGRFIMGSSWSSEVDARIVKLQIDRFDLQFTQLNAAARYYPSRKWGLELGGGADAAKVTFDKRAGGGESAPSGRIKYSLTNIRLGAIYVL